MKEEKLFGKAKVVAIASGKGGVGKSTVTANLALSLKLQGYRVGIIDADIYGPSQVMLLGAHGEQHVLSEGQKIIPITKQGVSFVSMASLLGDDAPVIWRAPMAVKVIQQFLTGVEWGDLDYLLIDLPPGTGDIQLTLAQQTFLHGVVIVTTPQQVAVGVAKKGLQMFLEVGVPVLGVIENMKGFVCPHCHETTSVFQEGGGEKLAHHYNVSYFGGIPLDPQMAQSGDAGVPIVVSAPESFVGESFLKVATSFHEAVLKQEKEDRTLLPEEITPVDHGLALYLKWADGVEGRLETRSLRYECPCALCVSEDTGLRVVKLSDIPLDIRLTGHQKVGRYGLSLSYSDQHKTGIYHFNDLKKKILEKSQEFFV